MKWNKPELVKFNDALYKERAKDMSPDALWVRECLKYRTKVSSGAGVAFSGVMFVPTLGVSTLGLWISGRTLDVARRKERIIEAEIERRLLPHYEKKKRDTLIPLGLSIAVITTIGIIDVICLAGTSSAVLNSVAPHGTEALGTLAQHPGEFLPSVWHGISFQGQQFFHLGGQHLAVGMDHLQTFINGDGLHQCLQPLSSGAFPYGQDATTANVLGQLEAQATLAAHNILAPNWTSHALETQAADQFIQQVALHGNATQLAGTNVGMKIAETAETHAAQFVIANTGLQGVRTSINMNDSSAIRKCGSSGRGSDVLELTQPVTSDQIADEVYSQVLTGATQKEFIFLSKMGQPISQRIVVPLTSQPCKHSVSKKKRLTCHFCASDTNPLAQAYYHCCICSPRGGGFDICEACVAGRGCSCFNRNQHILYRKGLLTPGVTYGDLGQAGPRNLKKREKKSKASNAEPRPRKTSKSQFNWFRKDKDDEQVQQAEKSLSHILQNEKNIDDMLDSDTDSLTFFEDEEELGRLIDKGRFSTWKSES